MTSKRVKHSKHPLYQTWRSMVHRCVQLNNVCWKSYGGRGITVCDEWMTGGFVAFRDHALACGWKPNSGLSIDRIDNDGNYEPSNVRVITMAENQRLGQLGNRKGCRPPLLSAADMKLARAFRRLGRSEQAIADSFGIGQSTLSRYLRGIMGSQGHAAERVA